MKSRSTGSIHHNQSHYPAQTCCQALHIRQMRRSSRIEATHRASAVSRRPKLMHPSLLLKMNHRPMITSVESKSRILPDQSPLCDPVYAHSAWFRSVTAHALHSESDQPHRQELECSSVPLLVVSELFRATDVPKSDWRCATPPPYTHRRVLKRTVAMATTNRTRRGTEPDG